jgi:phage baseplate assembly protein W
MANTSNNEKIFASDLAFKPTVSNTGDLSVVTNRAAINQSLFNIIKTRKGSRVGNPEFGAGVETFLFEPLTQDTAEAMGKAIVSQITLWEPRINILSTEMKVYDAPQAGYELSIRYIILQTFTEGDYSLFLTKQI